jgi:plasmid stabilization system protein ParE
VTVRWSDRALRDMAEIFDYIATDNEQAALGISDRIFQAAERLAVMPRLGRASELRRRRELIVDQHIVLYAIHRDEVLIQTIRHGARRR